MKTTFSRQFAMIAALLLLCLLITGVSFRFLMLGTIESQNQQTMIRDAEAVAELAEAYDSVGDLQNNFDFHISLSLFTKVGDAEALLCDTDGVIRICSCEKFSCDHIGQTVDPVLLAEIQKDGSWYEETSLSSIYDEPRYLAGQTLLASDGEQIGYVLVSAPMAQTKNFMLRSSTLFFYVAIAVLVVSMLAASFLSRMQVRPLGQMADAARRFGRGELGVRVEESPKNTSEINDLARAFNTMVDSLESALARKCCAITGADGFMATDISDKADFRLHFYNSDGTRGEMCGNGARCICRFGHDIGLAGDVMTVETDAGLVPGWRLDENLYRVKLNNPYVLDLHRKGDVAYLELGHPGVPHAVAEYKGDLWADADKLLETFRALRFDPAFPKGANVNFYQLLGDGEIRILTFERGVEGYTRACGTGCGSVASVLWKKGLLPGGVLTAHNMGGTLKITIDGENGNVTSLLLEGPTEITKIYDLDI